MPTRVTGTYPDVLAGRPVRFTACGKVLLLPGANQVTEPATDRYSVQDVVLARPGARVLDPAAQRPCPPPGQRPWPGGPRGGSCG